MTRTTHTNRPITRRVETLERKDMHRPSPVQAEEATDLGGWDFVGRLECTGASSETRHCMKPHQIWNAENENEHEQKSSSSAWDEESALFFSSDNFPD